MKKRPDTRILRAILSQSWKQHPTKQQHYGHLPPITITIQVRRTRYTGHYWRSRNELISNIPLWTPSHRRANGRRPARTYIQSSVLIQNVALKTYWRYEMMIYIYITLHCSRMCLLDSLYKGNISSNFIIFSHSSNQDITGMIVEVEPSL